MAPIKLHVGLTSEGMRAMSCLFEKDIDFDMVFVDWMAGETKTETFLSQFNPFGQVPVLEDGDLKLFESRAITRYLAETYKEKGTQLIPSEPESAALVSMWLAVEAHQFDPPASTLVKELVINPLLGQTTNTLLVKESESKLSKVLEVYEARLTESKYLAGDTFTLADLHHLPVIHYLLGTELKNLVESRPHVMAWVKEMRARPAWEKTFSMENRIIDSIKERRGLVDSVEEHPAVGQVKAPASVDLVGGVHNV